MSLDTRIKQAVIDTALRHQLKNLSGNQERGTERICRNLIDLGVTLCSRNISAEEQERLYRELFTLLRQSGKNKAADHEAIRCWMTSVFL